MGYGESRICEMSHTNAENLDRMFAGANTGTRISCYLMKIRRAGSCQTLLPSLAALLVPLAACAFSANVIEGRVLEAETNKPLAGTIVVARWDKTYSSFADTTTVCIHVESVITNEHGYFTLTAWNGKAGDVEVFKAGYEYPTDRYGAHAGKYEYVLKPFAGSREERLGYLERVERSIRVCRSPDAGEKNLLPLYRALYDEAKSLAKTKEEQKVPDGFLAGIELIEFGYKEGMRRILERAEKRDRQP